MKVRRLIMACVGATFLLLGAAKASEVTATYNVSAYNFSGVNPPLSVFNAKFTVTFDPIQSTLTPTEEGLIVDSINFQPFGPPKLLYDSGTDTLSIANIFVDAGYDPSHPDYRPAVGDIYGPDFAVVIAHASGTPIFDGTSYYTPELGSFGTLHGQVTLTEVPEPDSIAVFALAVLCHLLTRKHQTCRSVLQRT